MPGIGSENFGVKARDQMQGEVISKCLMNLDEIFEQIKGYLEQSGEGSSVELQVVEQLMTGNAKW